MIAVAPDQPEAFRLFEELAQAMAVAPGQPLVFGRVEQAVVQVIVGAVLQVLDRQVEPVMEIVGLDAALAGFEGVQQQPRGDVAEVDGNRLVHAFHVVVSDPVRFLAHAEGMDATAPVAAVGIQREQFIQAVETVYDIGQHLFLPPVPVAIHFQRFGEADVHVGLAQQQVALDQQLLGEATVDALVEQPCRLVQQIVADAQGVEGDVGGHDPGRLEGADEQCLAVLETELFGPAVDAFVIAARVVAQQRGLEGIQGQRDDRRATMLLASFHGGSRVDAETPLGIQHPLVLDHAALGKDHQLAPVQHLAGQKGEQPRQVVRHHADGAQKGAEAFVVEEFGCGYGTAIDPGLFVHQVLRDKGFEAGEVVEQEDVAPLDQAPGVVRRIGVQLHLQFQQAPGDAESPGHPVVGAGDAIGIPGIAGGLDRLIHLWLPAG